MKNWLSNSVTSQPSTHFYTGTEATTVNDSNWSDYQNLQGGDPKILWDAPTTNDPNIVPQTIQVSDTNPSEGDSITITVDLAASATGPLYYTIEAVPGSSIDASDFDSGSLSGSFSLT